MGFCSGNRGLGPPPGSVCTGWQRGFGRRAAGRRLLASASVERLGGITPKETSAADWEAIVVIPSSRLWRPASWAKTRALNQAPPADHADGTSGARGFHQSFDGRSDIRFYTWPRMIAPWITARILLLIECENDNLTLPKGKALRA